MSPVSWVIFGCIAAAFVFALVRTLRAASRGECIGCENADSCPHKGHHTASCSTAPAKTPAGAAPSGTGISKNAAPCATCQHKSCASCPARSAYHTKEE